MNGEIGTDYIPKREEHYTYRCQYCDFECVKESGLPSGLPVTKQGNYGSNATPAPVTYDETIYTAFTISFTAASGSDSAKINDSALQFADNHFQPGMVIIIVSTSGLNDGTKTIAEARSVSRGEIILSSSDTLTTETAAAAGEVILKRRIYQPGTMRGCSFCGSLNSRGEKIIN